MMFNPTATFDLGFCHWQPWVLVSLLLQFFSVLFGLAFSPGCCCMVECSLCESDTTPDTIEVTFTGVADQICTSCNSFNTTVFVLSQGTASCCYWTASVPCNTGGSPFAVSKICALYAFFENNFTPGTVRAGVSALCVVSTYTCDVTDCAAAAPGAELSFSETVEVAGDNLIDCTVERNPTLLYDFDGTCNWFAATVTMTPL